VKFKLFKFKRSLEITSIGPMLLTIYNFIRLLIGYDYTLAETPK